MKTKTEYPRCIHLRVTMMKLVTNLAVVMIAVFSISSLLVTPCFGEIFRYVDENGVMHLTDKPNHPKAEPLRNRKTNAERLKAYHSPRQLKKRFNGYADRIGRRFNIDPYLVRAVIQVESAFNHMAVSPKGAQGLMQIMPATAKRYGVKNPFDPYENIEGGVRYLRYLFKLFDGDLQLILASYNCGENRVRREKKVPNITETQNYVKKVLKIYSQYKSSTPQQIVKYTDEKGIIHLTNRPNATF